MKRFLLLIREDIARLQSLSDSEIQNEIAVMTRWVEDLTKSGNFIQGDPLDATFRVATKNKIISDGPFIEAREAVFDVNLDCVFVAAQHELGNALDGSV